MGRSQNSRRAERVYFRVGGAASLVDGLAVEAPVCCDGYVAINVLGSELQPCSLDPLTGFYRNGCCDTGSEDTGVHTVCVVMTEEFLDFSLSQGNDLLTPMPAFGFAGLKPGDSWCLCAPRWQQAFEAGAAPGVVLESTHLATLEWASLDDLRAHAVTR